MSLRLSKKGVIPYSIRSFFAREAISPIFDLNRRCRIKSGMTVLNFHYLVKRPLDAYFNDFISNSRYFRN